MVFSAIFLFINNVGHYWTEDKQGRKKRLLRQVRSSLRGRQENLYLLQIVALTWQSGAWYVTDCFASLAMTEMVAMTKRRGFAYNIGILKHSVLIFVITINSYGKRWFCLYYVK
jgi:hypothetical protein